MKFEYKITITYMFMGFLWIFFSDQFLDSNNNPITRFQTYKGIFYVTVTSFLLYYLVKKQSKKQEKSENEIKEKNVFIQTVLDNLPLGVALNTINDGKVIYMNKRFTQIYGWSQEDMEYISEFFQKVYPDENYRNEIMNRVFKDINSGIAENMHWENVKITQKSGTQRYVNAVNIPLAEQNTMVSTVWDITDLHRIQEDLVDAKEKAEESNRLKSAFLQNMSHEIRTPLNAIVGFSELIIKPDQSKEKMQHFSEMISNSSDKLIEIVTDVIEIAQVQSKQVKPFYEKFELISFLENIEKKFVKKIKNKPIELFWNINTLSTEYFVQTDKGKLQKIIDHILDNALKFTNQGFIQVNCKIEIENLELTVSDTGIGIPYNMQDIIFEPFRQIESDINCRHYGGNGLGLSLVKAYTKLLNGSVSFISTPNKGSKFTISLPLQITESEGDKIYSSDIPTSTILIVEDEYINYQYLLAILENSKMKILHASNGKQAVDFCKENKEIDLILMDIKMPIMDGYTAANCIKKFRPELPIIAQSAYALSNERENYSEVFDDYLTKPILEEVLEEKITKYIVN